MTGSNSSGIVTIGTGQVRQVTDLLVAAFAQEAVSRWLAPDVATRPRMLRWLFTRYTATCFSTGNTQLLYAGGDGEDEEPVAAALWFERPTPAKNDPTVDLGERGRWNAFEQATTAAHPTAPHEYLMLMGVHPDHHGKGLGTRLLQRRLEWLDTAGTPAYLEATSPGSRALYTRHGFRDHARPIRLPDGPDLYPMWRTPQAPRAHPPAPRQGKTTTGGSPWMS
jgi:GNAT superfamily N-acetyltransferase